MSVVDKRVSTHEYFAVYKTFDGQEEISFESLSSVDCGNHASDLERRGFSTAIYRIDRDSATDHTKKA